MWDASFALAHEPPKCKRFGEEIMRSFNNLARDRTQNRNPLLLIAPPARQTRWSARRSEDDGSHFDNFTPPQGAVTDRFQTSRRRQASKT
jgi:hypothetical protein